jgi:hypothetical protein
MQGHFKTVKFGLMTLQQDKQMDRMNKLMNFMRLLSRKRRQSLKHGLLKIAGHSIRVNDLGLPAKQ